MLSPVRSILAGCAMSSSGGGGGGGGRRTWRRCKMEEAVARWMRHVVELGCFRRAPHPFVRSSSPLWYLHSPPSPPSCG